MFPELEPSYHAFLSAYGRPEWLEEAFSSAKAKLSGTSHGHMESYQRVLGSLRILAETSYPETELPPLSQVELEAGAVRVPGFGGIGKGSQKEAELRHLLEELKPWRKGPWYFGPLFLDCEWRSDLKWERLGAFLKETGGLGGQRVLDVGCGSGYHLWRMREAGASLAIGLEPFLLSVAQFASTMSGLDDWGLNASARSALAVLPLSLEESPNHGFFDTVFSMGVLSHTRSPFHHLSSLKSRLRPGGRIVLESLAIEGGEGQVLLPRGRYAKMRNVWFIPSAAELAGWLLRAGFREIQILDVSPTTIREQRGTEWMNFESLRDFLDPNDPSKTVEGYPAPMRAMLSAIT